MNIQNLAAYALNAVADTKYEMFSSEALAKAAEVTLLGMGMVFAVLSILWFALAIFKKIFAKDSDKGEAAKEPKVVEVSPAPVIEKVADDGELIAVLTAAIAAYRSTEEGLTGESVNGFRVVSFKRATKGRAWNSNK